MCRDVFVLQRWILSHTGICASCFTYYSQQSYSSHRSRRHNLLLHHTQNLGWGTRHCRTWTSLHQAENILSNNGQRSSQVLFILIYLWWYETLVIKRMDSKAYSQLFGKRARPYLAGIWVISIKEQNWGGGVEVFERHAIRGPWHRASSTLSNDSLPKRHPWCSACPSDFSAKANLVVFTFSIAVKRIKFHPSSINLKK